MDIKDLKVGDVLRVRNNYYSPVWCGVRGTITKIVNGVVYIKYGQRCPIPNTETAVYSLKHFELVQKSHMPEWF